MDRRLWRHHRLILRSPESSNYEYIVEGDTDRALGKPHRSVVDHDGLSGLRHRDHATHGLVHTGILTPYLRDRQHGRVHGIARRLRIGLGSERDDRAPVPGGTVRWQPHTYGF